MAGIRIVCEAAGIEATATLNDSLTARALLETLPVEAPARRWGREVYFDVPMRRDLESPVEQVSAGEIAYWPPGAAFCIFFGQQPYSAVEPLGGIDGDLDAFERVADGHLVRLEALA